MTRLEPGTIPRLQPQEQVPGLVSVCVVTRNASDSLRACLQSICTSAQSQPLEIIVVDNDSTDETHAMLQQDFPQARLIHNKPGLGFSKGINQAWQHARGEYVLISTPSSRPQGHCLEAMVQYLATHDDVGLVGPRITNRDGITQYSSKKFPSPRLAFWKMLHNFHLIRDNRMIRDHFFMDCKEDEPVEVESITMAFLLSRWEVGLELGLLDEYFFTWASDVDWCHRVNQSQWRQIFLPMFQTIHMRSSVSNKEPLVNGVLYYNDLKRFYLKYFWPKYSLPENLFWLSGLYVPLGIRLFLNFISKKKVVRGE